METGYYVSTCPDKLKDGEVFTSRSGLKLCMVRIAYPDTLYGKFLRWLCKDKIKIWVHGLTPVGKKSFESAQLWFQSLRNEA